MKEVEFSLGRVAVLIVSLCSTSSFAKTVNTQTFTPSTSKNYLLVEAPMSFGFTPEWLLEASYNYTPDPLVIVSGDRSLRLTSVVSAIQTLDLQAGYFLNPRFLVGMHLPIQSVQLGPDYGSGSFQTSLGDLRPFLKMRLNPMNRLFSWGLLIDVLLPTGKKDTFVSDESFAPSFRFLIEQRMGNFSLAGHFGYRYSTSATFSNLNERHRLLYAVAARFSLDEVGRWAINGEFGGWSVLPFSQQNNPASLLGGVLWSPRSNIEINLAGGLGKVSGPQGSTYRVVTGFKYIIPVMRRADLTTPPMKADKRQKE